MHMHVSTYIAPGLHTHTHIHTHTPHMHVCTYAAPGSRTHAHTHTHTHTLARMQPSMYACMYMYVHTQHLGRSLATHHGRDGLGDRRQDVFGSAERQGDELLGKGAHLLRVDGFRVVLVLHTPTHTCCVRICL